jgi:hypothetical protein
MRTSVFTFLSLFFACVWPLAAQRPAVGWKLSHSTSLLAAPLTSTSKIIAGEKEVWNLGICKDFDGWSKPMTDDLLAVYSTGYASKVEVLEAIQGMGGGHYSMDDVRVIPVCDTAGLIVYKVTEDWKENGKQMAPQCCVSSPWKKHEGKWLSRFWQETDTRLPDDQLIAQALACAQRSHMCCEQGLSLPISG